MTVRLTIESAGAALRAGEITSRQLTEVVLARIDRENDRLGAVVGRCGSAALEAATQADWELARGKDRGPLHGVPVALKDILATSDAPTTAQSLAMSPGYEGFDSAAAASLRHAGAVIVGKAACSEFACGSPDPTKPFPLPRNPWDLDRWAGGSSAGTASGIAAGFFLGGVGTDSGGSIRVPAAFCGVTGLKPTFGLVSRFGCVPVSESMDHIGPMARSARDCALLLSALAGPDSRDPACAGAPKPESYVAALTGDLTGMRIGIDRDHHARAGVAAEIVDVFEKAVSELEKAGAQLTQVTVPLADEVFAATRIVMGSELFAVHQDNLRSRWSDYGKPTRLLIATGAFYGAADYLRAQRILAASAQRVADLFSTIDCVISLTSPTAACRFDEIGLGLRMQLPVFTSYWNGLGMPAVAVPIGPALEGASSGLPLSMQVSGPKFADATVLKVADAYQARTNWHLRVPPVLRLAEQGHAVLASSRQV